MKITYAEKPVETSKPKAFIDVDGDLVLIDCRFTNAGVVLTSSGEVISYDKDDITRAQAKAKRLFFSGDSVTLNF